MIIAATAVDAWLEHHSIDGNKQWSKKKELEA